MRAGHGDKILCPHEPFRLLLYPVQHVRDRDPVERVCPSAASGKGDGLIVDAQHSRILQAKAQHVAHLVLIDALHHGGNQHSPQTLFCQVLERLLFDRAQVAAAQGLVRGRLEAIELQVDDRPGSGQFVDKGPVAGQAKPIRVEHHVADISLLGGSQDVQDLGVNGRLPTADLDHLGPAFGFHETVKYRFDLTQPEIVARTGIGKAGRTSQIAAAGHLDDADTGMLLVLRTQATVRRATAIDRGRKTVWYRAGFVVPLCAQVPIGIGRDQGLVPAVLRAALPQIQGTIANQHLSIDDLATLWAHAAGDVMKNVVAGRLFGVQVARLPFSA